MTRNKWNYQEILPQIVASDIPCDTYMFST